MSDKKLFMIEFSVDDYDIWNYPADLDDPEELQTCVRFVMPPNVCMEICDTNLDGEKCRSSGKFVKNAMFSMSDGDISKVISGELQVSKKICENHNYVVGNYKFEPFNALFKRLVDLHAQQLKKDPCNSQLTTETMKELVQLTDTKDQIVGTSMFTLRFSCFGSTINQNLNILRDGEFIKSSENNPHFGTRCYPVENKTTTPNAKEHNCLSNKKCPSTESVKSIWSRVNDPSPDKTKFDEFAAEVNGNALIVRINKDNPSYMVTRISGSEVVPCPCSNEPKCPTKCAFAKEPICLSKYPSKCPRTCPKNCPAKCLKNCPSKSSNSDSPDKYRCHTPPKRNICLQVHPNNITNGKCKLPKGIEICQKGCNRDDIDVFILKIGRKCSSQNQKNEIELELRTPKGPEICEPRPKESREVQVIESEFEDPSKVSKKKANNENPKMKANNETTKMKAMIKEQPKRKLSCKIKNTY
ncbi:unnamed protein product [Diamesa hyperborea]